MSFGDRLNNSSQAATSRDEEKKEAATRRSASLMALYERKQKDALSRAEHYYKTYLSPIVLDIYQKMGGSGPNPDGSLPWRGGKSWSENPYYRTTPELSKFSEDLDVVVTIHSGVTWSYSRTWSSRYSCYHHYNIHGIYFQINSLGMLTCRLAEKNEFVFDIKIPEGRKRFEAKAIDLVVNDRDSHGELYSSRRRSMELPDWLQTENAHKEAALTKENARNKVIPLFHRLARRFGVNTSQDMYTSKFLFSRTEYSVPVNPGIEIKEESLFSVSLAVKILEVKDLYHSTAHGVGVWLRGNEVHLSCTLQDQYLNEEFDISTEQGLLRLEEKLIELINSHSRVSFSNEPPPVYYDTP